jgi:hypothetical protein
MSEVQGKLEIQGTQDNLTRIELNGDNGSITAGGSAQTGALLLRDAQEKERIRLGLIKVFGPQQVGGSTAPQVVAQYWGMRIKDANGEDLMRIGFIPAPKVGAAPSASTVSLILGATGHAGLLQLNNNNGAPRVRLGQEANGTDSELEIRNENNTEKTQIKGGEVTLQRSNKPVVRLDASSSTAWIGGNGDDGNILLFPASGDNSSLATSTVRLSGQSGQLQLGKKGSLQKSRVELDGATGQVALRAGNADTIFLDGSKGQMTLRADDKNRILLESARGYIELNDENGATKMRLFGSHGHAWLGGHGEGGLVAIFPSTADNVTDTTKASIFLDGNAGDIILQNADCAEEFDVAADVTVEPGTVMVIDDEGRMRPSSTSYDRRVAGVVSGAGSLKPGIVLGRQTSSSTRLPIALTGKVNCYVDASSAPIETGDLLTTSNTPGCAMKALDTAQAFGAVIGKALSPLSTGNGLIPILVALQ